MPEETSVNIPLVLMITIIDRGHSKKITELFTSEGVRFTLLSLGVGTANSDLLDYLGLGETEKAILYSTMPAGLSKLILSRLQKELNLKKPGRGIAFTLPITSVCGSKVINHLKGVSNIERGIDMGEKKPFELIIAIANRGYSDEIMDAAKEAKATGGTVIHARGTGLKEAEKFFGITVQAEKEMVFILTKAERKAEIMKNIAGKAGIHTEARAIVFSLPVNDVAGLPDLLKTDEELLQNMKDDKVE